jgi:23S rRNA U2552 (ribose-2'-O)-methylase RlmE/FtsJ
MPTNNKTRKGSKKELKREEPSQQDYSSKINYEYLNIELKKPKINILDNEPTPNYSSEIDLPRFYLGFQHFTHAMKNKTVKFKDFEGKKKVYLVLNPFERYIDNYPDDMGNTSKKYFQIEKNKIPDILSRAFYKLWELLFLFDLIDKKQDKFVSAHLCEGPGSFIQATMFYRDMFAKNSKQDKFHAITLNSEDTPHYVPEIEKKFTEYYENEKPIRLIQHKTYNKKIARASVDKDDGDITNPKTLKLFGGQMDTKADFITADGGFEWANENTQEQEAYKLIFAEILGAIKIQAKGGNFVLKMFETFTPVSVKFIAILQDFYNKVYITKPLTSRISNSERYIVCMDFKFKDTDAEYKKYIKKLDEIHEKSHKNSKLYLLDIFPEYEMSQDLINSMIEANTFVANNQYKMVNEMLQYIDAKNYYGDVYQMRREQQIMAHKWWINKYFK